MKHALKDNEYDAYNVKHMHHVGCGKRSKHVNNDYVCPWNRLFVIDRMRIFNTLFFAEAKKIKLTYYTAGRILA